MCREAISTVAGYPGWPLNQRCLLCRTFWKGSNTALASLSTCLTHIQWTDMQPWPDSSLLCENMPSQDVRAVTVLSSCLASHMGPQDFWKILY